jgi:hypothetical protein
MIYEGIRLLDGAQGMYSTGVCTCSVYIPVRKYESSEAVLTVPDVIQPMQWYQRLSSVEILLTPVRH